ncbi:MAG: hypothetical protein NTX15_07930 [Candidatus Kapabacteria bacterium]|nr:hypothetical protein [Candidatus Kapabacteria bacterium]
MRTVIIDGGGSTTDVGLAIDGQCVARVSLPSVKPEAADLKTDQLCRMLGSFLATTTVTPDSDITSRLDGVIIGMAGIWTQAEVYRYKLSFHDDWETYVGNDVPNLVVMSDAELVLFGAHGSGAGQIVIAGTGSIALARDSAGTLHRCGGWGPRIGDEGGGFWLGREAFVAVARMLDGRGPSTLLIRPVAAYLRADPEDHMSVRAAMRGVSTDGAARLGHAVLTYAEEGDDVACVILERGARALSELINTIYTVDSETVTAYGSLWVNNGYCTAVERLCRKQIHVLDDVVIAVIDKLPQY